MTDVGTRSDLPVPGGRRRIDRLLAPGYLAELPGLSLDEIRGRRREVEQEDVDLSYRHELVRGRLAVVRAELERRSEGAPAGDLIKRLPEILTSDATDGSDQPAANRFVRLEPAVLDRRRRLEDKLLADTAVPDVQVHAAEDLRLLSATLVEFEAVLARRRRRVRAVLDALSAELTSRYRNGAASIERLIPEGRPRD